MDSIMDESSPEEQLVEEFFRAAHVPATTHEEWLLRHCAELMHREAAMISFAEQKGSNQRQWRNRRSYRNSETSTAPSTGTPDESSS